MNALDTVLENIDEADLTWQELKINNEEKKITNVYEIKFFNFYMLKFQRNL